MKIAQWFDLRATPEVSPKFVRTRRCALLMTIRTGIKGYIEFRRASTLKGLRAGDTIKLCSVIEVS